MTSNAPELSSRFPSLMPRNNAPSRVATNSRDEPTKINSLLSSPTTAINPPVASFCSNLSLSGIEEIPEAEEYRPLPRLI